MNNRFFNCRVYLVLVLTALRLSALAQSGIKAEARLDKISIPLGDQTTIHLSISFPAKDSVKFPLLRDTLAGKVLIVKTRTDTSFAKDDVSQETITRHITVTAFEPGTYTIAPFIFHTKNGDFSTKELTLQVLPVQVDTSKAFYDIKQPLVVNYTFADWLLDWWYIIIIPLVLALLAFYIYRYFKKRRNSAPATEPLKTIMVPEHEIALKKLEDLNAKKLWQQDLVKQYYSELTDIIREYLEKRFHIKAQEKTSAEIFDSLRFVSLDEDDQRRLKEILFTADLVKFAKGQPLPFENERSIENAMSFVVHTQRAAAVKDEKEDKGDKNSNGLS